ncbi:hypothetical protein DAD99_17505 [Pseudarthrobacter sp. AB1]|nr:hypothetical protein [Pseudarthrobacter sp. AB1]
MLFHHTGPAKGGWDRAGICDSAPESNTPTTVTADWNSRQTLISEIMSAPAREWRDRMPRPTGRENDSIYPMDLYVALLFSKSFRCCARGSPPLQRSSLRFRPGDLEPAPTSEHADRRHPDNRYRSQHSGNPS